MRAFSAAILAVTLTAVISSVMCAWAQKPLHLHALTWLCYDPCIVSIKGRIAIQKDRIPPHVMHSGKFGQAIRVYVFIPDHPVNVKARSHAKFYGDTFLGLKMLQLVPGHGIGAFSFRKVAVLLNKNLGKKVQICGSLIEPLFYDYDVTRVELSVRSLRQAYSGIHDSSQQCRSRPETHY